MTPYYWAKPGRLLSLWEIMNTADLKDLHKRIIDLAKMEAQFETATSVSDEERESFGKKIADTVRAAEKVGILGLGQQYDFIGQDAVKNKRGPDRMAGHARAAHKAITDRLAGRHYLFVAEDRATLVDNPQLFGPVVAAAFPSAQRDLCEAGNCLAAECHTAAVFHLMRAAEFALRALAQDRLPTKGKRYFAGRDWGKLLADLETVVEALGDDKKHPVGNWPDKDVRTRQLSFYGRAMRAFSSFNVGWRRVVSHGREDSFYDREEAHIVLMYVRTFMRELADAGITEGGTTPEYWTS